MKKIFNLKYFVVFLSFLLNSPIAFSRWQTKQDASQFIGKNHSVFQVKKDGSYTLEKTLRIKILKESARESYSKYRLTYNTRSEKLQILSAKVITNGKSFPVPDHLIEDKSLASAQKGFDQMRQIAIAFLHLEVGSILYIKYRIQVKNVAFKNFFSLRYMWLGYFRHTEIIIESEKPLFYKFYNADKYFKTSYRAYSKDKYVFKTVLRKPIIKDIIEEKKSFFNPLSVPSLQIATAKKWSQVVKSIAMEYEKIITEKLPKLHQQIFLKAKKTKKKDLKQIEFVIAQLIEKIRYFGDWRPIKGAYVPRPLQKIAETGFGDCKDLSVSLSAILRKLGYQADVVAVYRSAVYHPANEQFFTLPHTGLFNHAIVRAEKEGKVYWLDPTNRVSYVKGVFRDIAGRSAVLLKPSLSEVLLKIPQLQSNDSLYKQNFYFKINKKKEYIKVDGQFQMQGGATVGFTGASLYGSKENIDYQLMQYQPVDMDEVIKWKITGYDLSSRIVRDFSYKVYYTISLDSRPFNLFTQLGQTVSLPIWDQVNRLFVRSKKRVSDLFLGSPHQVETTIKISHIKPVGDINLINCHLKSPWMDFHRKVLSAKPLKIKDFYNFKTNFVSSKDLKTLKFAKLKNGLKKCLLDFRIIYKMAQLK